MSGIPAAPVPPIPPPAEGHRRRRPPGSCPALVDPAHDERDDAVLLRSHTAGDRDAFAVLVHRHQPWMWTIAVTMLGEHDDAMDAVQAAFARVLRSSGTWRGTGSVAGWLYRIVTRAALRTLIARDRLPAPVGTAENPCFEQMVVADNAESTAMERVLREVVAALPVERRECFVRADLLGFTFAEVASDLGLPEGTVKSRRARGKTQLLVALHDADLIGPSRGPGHPPHQRESQS